MFFESFILVYNVFWSYPPYSLRLLGWNTTTKRQVGRRRGFCHSQLHRTAHHLKQWGRELKQGGNLEAGADVEAISGALQVQRSKPAWAIKQVEQTETERQTDKPHTRTHTHAALSGLTKLNHRILWCPLCPDDFSTGHLSYSYYKPESFLQIRLFQQVTHLRHRRIWTHQNELLMDKGG